MIFDRSFPNQLTELSRVTDEAMAFLQENGISTRIQYAMNLAIEEMGTNILKYGYDDHNEHRIRICLKLIDNKVTLILEDDGHEFNPLKAPEPDLTLKLEDRVPGGLGICLVRQFANDVHYVRDKDRNIFTVSINREPPVAPA